MDNAETTQSDGAFQMLAAATGKAQLQTVHSLKDRNIKLTGSSSMCRPYTPYNSNNDMNTQKRLCDLQFKYWWLVQNSGNGVRHITEVKLRRARLVLALVTTWHLSTPVRPTQPGHPSVGRWNEYRRWRPSVGRNGASEVTTLWRFINQFLNKHSADGAIKGKWGQRCHQ